MNEVTVLFKKINPDAKIPVQTAGNGGMDMTCVSKDVTDKFIEYGTGICASIPEGYVGLLFPRSSVTKYDLMLKNAVGVIDSSYVGEIKARFVTVYNDYCNIYECDCICSSCKIELNGKVKAYEIGEKCCQLIIVPYPKVTSKEVDELPETERGAGGFGSTGK